MRIGIITDNIREQSTGIGFYAKSIIKQLVTSDQKNNYFFIDFMKTTFNKNRLFYIHNPFTFIKTYAWHTYLPYKMNNMPFDYIINMSGCPHFSVFRQKEIFFVYDISWYLYPQYHPIGRVLYHKLFFTKTLKNCYRIVVDSQSTKKDLIKYFNIPREKIDIIYPSFDTNQHAFTKSNTIKPFILFIGTIEPRKNLDTVIRAYNIIKRKMDIPHKLIICGKRGWKYKETFQLINKLGLEKDIIYKGYISNQYKKWSLQHATLFVYPSHYEGFGMPVVEALINSCPVITSNVSSLPEAVGDAGLLVSPNNVNELVNAMEKIIYSKIVRTRLMKKRIKHLSKIDNKKQIISFIQSLK